MSLFEDSKYQYRETIFVLFTSQNRPTAAAFQEALRDLGNRYEVTNVQQDANKMFESLTLKAPYDHAAMDITYVEGEDVTGQVAELNDDLRNSTLSGMEIEKLAKLGECDARFDIYHFEEIAEIEDDGLDPGSLLIVQENLAKLTEGVGIDPQSGSLM